jgi:hypothetical protein
MIEGFQTRPSQHRTTMACHLPEPSGKPQCGVNDQPDSESTNSRLHRRRYWGSVLNISNIKNMSKRG